MHFGWGAISGYMPQADSPAKVQLSTQDVADIMALATRWRLLCVFQLQPHPAGLLQGVQLFNISEAQERQRLQEDAASQSSPQVRMGRTANDKPLISSSDDSHGMCRPSLHAHQAATKKTHCLPLNHNTPPTTSHPAPVTS